MTVLQTPIHEVALLLEDFAEDIQALENVLGSDVPSSLNKIRYITEKALHQLCTKKNITWGEAEPTLERMLGPVIAAGALPKNVAVHVRTIQGNTSPGSHFQETPLTESHVTIAVSALNEFLLWYHNITKRRPARTRVPRTKDTIKMEVPGAELVNPYEFAATATKQTFKGRAEELAELHDSIRSGTHTAIFGLQRMGKTSLIEEGLQEVLELDPRLQKEVLLVRIDLQRLGGDQVKYRDLVQAIIEAITEKLATLGIGRALQDLRGLTHELFAANRFQRGCRTEFFAMLAKLLRGFATAARRRIVLFVDEFSEVRKVIDRNRAALQQNPNRPAHVLPHDLYIDVPFIHHLGSLLKDRELMAKFTLIVLVRPFMAEYDDREELQILKLMKPITLYYLDRQAAEALIHEPLLGRITFEAGVPDELYQVTAGHPYLLQFMLKMLVDRIKRDGRRVITGEDVRWIEKRMVSEGPAYDAQFEVLISDYSVAETMHPKEGLLGKGALALVGKIGQEQADRWVYEEQIFDALLQHKVPVEKSASLLSQLTRTKILEEAILDGRLCYRIAVPLLHRRFVEQNMYLKYFR